MIRLYFQFNLFFLRCESGAAVNRLMNRLISMCRYIPALTRLTILFFSISESVKVVGVDGFDLRAWTVGFMSRVSDVGFSIRSSSHDTVVSLAVSPTRQMVFYAHNPGRLVSCI